MNQANTLQQPKETAASNTDASGTDASGRDASGRDASGRDVDLERSMQVLHAQAMIPQAAAARRHSHHARRFRSNATGIAASTGLSRKSCSNRTNQAVILVDHLPQIYAAYASCVMNRSQIDLICRLHNDRVLRPFLEQSQWVFLNIAGESWPVFRQRADQ